jgi:hypothetical protein
LPKGKGHGHEERLKVRAWARGRHGQEEGMYRL